MERKSDQAEKKKSPKKAMKGKKIRKKALLKEDGGEKLAGK